MIAKEILCENDYACVVVKDGELKHAIKGMGIKPLLNIYLENLIDLEDSSVADKVIGKAAASIMICSKIKDVYADVITEKAYEMLMENNIDIEYGVLVSSIKNRLNDGPCPLENLVKETEVPIDIVNAIIDFFK